MKKKTLILTIGALTASLAGAALQLQDQDTNRAQPDPSLSGRLIKVVPASDFDRQEWGKRLEAADLNQREQSYDQLLHLANRSEEARAALQDWALGTDELAWTARLALRELERSPVPSPRRGRLFPHPIFEDFGDDGFGPAGDPFERMREHMDSLLGGLGEDLGHGLLPQPLVLGPGASSEGRSVRVEQTPDGVSVIIEQTRDGETETRTFEADSLEELYAVHPELQRELGLQIETDPGMGLVRPAVPRRLSKPGREVTRTDILGVYLRSPSVWDGESSDESGLEVESTLPGTIASALRLRRGDVLLSLNGVPLRSIEDVKSALGSRAPDEAVELEILGRDGETETLRWSPSSGS